MTFSYFPGCTLKTKGKQLDLYGRKAAQALGFELCELPDWQCCGAVYPMAKDEIATRLSSVRALAAARDAGQELVTLCSACHHVIKRVNGDLQRDETVVEGKEFAKKQVDKLMENAKACGAQELITACPLCMYNLTANAEAGLPVHYFTELLAEALGVKEDAE